MSVYATRVNMGTKLGEKIAREWADKDIDVVIPIPETSCDVALEIASALNLPYRQGFVKNRYVGVLSLCLVKKCVRNQFVKN